MNESKPVKFDNNHVTMKEENNQPPVLSDDEWRKKIELAKQQKEQESIKEPDTATEPEEKVDDPIPVPEEKTEEETVVNEEPKSADETTQTNTERNQSIISYWKDSVGEDPIEGVPEYQPTEEEIERSKRIVNKKADDASTVIACPLGSENEFVKSFEYIRNFMEKYKDLSKEDIEANPQIKEVLKWLNALNTLTETTLGTSQQKLMMQMVDAINTNGTKLEKLVKELGISKLSSGLTNNGRPELFRGEAAMQVINNRYRGVYKIQLHNSGFWIKIMPLRNIDIDAWLHEVDFEKKQLGRLVGGHFYLGMNIYLKEKLADLVRATTVDANLENWKDGTTLIDNISIHDYDTLCWAYATMMHRDGVSISTVCVNPECKHQNTAQFLDLAKLTYINPDVYTKEAMAWMLAGNAPGVIRTQKDLKHYKEDLLKNVKVINFTPTDQYELKDPSLGEFVRVGMAMLGTLAAHVKDGKLTEDNEEVRRYSVYHLTKMLSPWISKIILNDEDGAVLGVIDDHDAITKSLETSLDDEYNVISNIQEFITNSKISFFSATSLKCPKCGHQPNLLADNIYPLDIEYVLFCLSYLKLEQIGVTL